MSYTKKELNALSRDVLRKMVADSVIDCVPTKLNKEECIDVLISKNCPEDKKRKIKSPMGSPKKSSKPTTSSKATSSKATSSKATSSKATSSKASKSQSDEEDEIRAKILKKQKKLSKLSDKEMDEEKRHKKTEKTEKKLEILREKLKKFLSSSDSDISDSESESDIKEVVSESVQPNRESELKAMSFTELRELVKKMNKGCKIGGAGVTKEYLISTIIRDECNDDMKVKAPKKASPKKTSPKKDSPKPKEESEEDSFVPQGSGKSYSKEELGEMETSDLKTIASKMGIKIPVGKGRAYIMSAILDDSVPKEKGSPKASSPKASSPKASSPKASSPKASSKSKSFEDFTAAELKEMLAKKGITKNIPLSKKERIELLEADACDPDNQLFCTDGKACHVENRICVHDKGDKFAKVLSRTVINGKIVIGDKKVIDELKARMEAEPVSLDDSKYESSLDPPLSVIKEKVQVETSTLKRSPQKESMEKIEELEVKVSPRKLKELPKKPSREAPVLETDSESESEKPEIKSESESDEESELKSVDEGSKTQDTKRDIVMRLSRELRNCLFPTAKKV